MTAGELLQVHCQHRSSALQGDGLIERQPVWTLQQEQSAELRPSVTQPYLIFIDTPQDGVLTRHTNVGDPDVSVVCTADYGLLVVGHLDYMNEPQSHILMLLKALQYHILA